METLCRKVGSLCSHSYYAVTDFMIVKLITGASIAVPTRDTKLISNDVPAIILPAINKYVFEPPENDKRIVSYDFLC